MTTSAGKSAGGIVAALSLSLLVLLGSCNGQLASPLASFRGATMGTYYAVRLAQGQDNWPPDTTALQRSVEERLAEINRLMSTYDPNSELSRFNRYLGTDWFAVSPETAEVVRGALDISERTSGAFDPTIGPMVNLWGFGPTKGVVEPPSDQRIQEVLLQVGFRNVQVRQDPPALKKAIPELQLDLSGIAKGYAADNLSEMLTEKGYRNCMVDIGGEVRTRGAKPQQQPWRIGVEKPDSAGRPVQLAVPLTDSGIATSGDYRNYYQHEGIRYSHTIDPTTGRPVEHDVASVSIVASSCMEADALATAVLVMGPEHGYDWCEQHGLVAFLLVREGQQFSELRTSAFEKLFGK